MGLHRNRIGLHSLDITSTESQHDCDEAKSLKNPLYKIAMLTYLHWEQWNGSTIRNDSSYVDMFGNTFMQSDSYVSIDVNSFNGIRSRSSYSQLGWVVHLL